MACQHSGCGSTYALKTCAKCGKEFCYFHYEIVDGKVYCDQHKPKIVPLKGAAMKFSRGSSALIALVVTIIGLFLYQLTAKAETPEVELITDPDILAMIMEGKTPEVNIAATESIDRFWMRTLWDIKDPQEVWVALTSEPSNVVDLSRYTNGSLVFDQLSTDGSFREV